jgi:hypothetical protein
VDARRPDQFGTGEVPLLKRRSNRAALVEDDPDTYYLKEHYLNYSCVLVRLSRVRADALRDLVTGAYRFVSAKVGAKRAVRSRRGVAR